MAVIYGLGNDLKERTKWASEGDNSTVGSLTTSIWAKAHTLFDSFPMRKIQELGTKSNQLLDKQKVTLFIVPQHSTPGGLESLFCKTKNKLPVKSSALTDTLMSTGRIMNRWHVFGGNLAILKLSTDRRNK